MKILILLSIAIFFIGCKGSNSDKNHSPGPRIDSTIVVLNKGEFDSTLEYHNGFAVFYLPRRKIIHYCQTSHPELQERIDLLNFINSNRYTNLIITDSLMDELAVIEKNNRLDDIMPWATIDILKSGHAKVYDKKAQTFVDHIKFYEINEKYSGWIDIRLPNDSVIIHSSVWVR